MIILKIESKNVEYGIISQRKTVFRNKLVNNP